MSHDRTIPDLYRPEQAFDLNIEKVLEHWTVPFAIRELIANALDEQALTRTADPAIFKDAAGDWHVSRRGPRAAVRAPDAERERGESAGTLRSSASSAWG